MQRTGFVLAGGGSTRMGTDKALLIYRGTVLINHIAAVVYEAAGACAVIADPNRYSALSYPMHADRLPGCGPIGGLFTALSITTADWNLVVACDMPGISVEVLHALLERAQNSDHDCVAAAGSTGQPEPLCAVYHRHCLPVVEQAIRDKRLKMRDLVRELDAEAVLVDATALRNVNNPAEWAEYVQESK